MTTRSDKTTHGSGSGNDLEARIQRLEDMEAIRQLKHEYAAAADAMMKSPSDATVSRVASLFSADASGDYGPLGTCEGHAGLHAFFHKLTDMANWSIHSLSNPVTKVEGDRATGRWYVQVTVNMVGGETPGMQQTLGHYEDEFVRTPEGWKIRRCQFRPDAPPAST